MLFFVFDWIGWLFFLLNLYSFSSKWFGIGDGNFWKVDESYIIIELECEEINKNNIKNGLYDLFFKKSVYEFISYLCLSICINFIFF